MFNYKSLLEWLTLPFRPDIRKKRKKEIDKIRIKAVENARKELKEIPTRLRPKFEELKYHKRRKKQRKKRNVKQ